MAKLETTLSHNAQLTGYAEGRKAGKSSMNAEIFADGKKYRTIAEAFKTQVPSFITIQPKKKSLKLPKPIRKKSQVKICEDLWKQCIKARCKGLSELSGKPITCIHPHHIMHKPNYRLRFELENGIALSPYEHQRMAHGARSEEFRESLIKKIGQEKFDWLKSLRNGCQKTDLKAVEIYLRNKLRELQ